MAVAADGVGAVHHGVAVVEGDRAGVLHRLAGAAGQQQGPGGDAAADGAVGRAQPVPQVGPVGPGEQHALVTGGDAGARERVDRGRQHERRGDRAALRVDHGRLELVGRGGGARDPGQHDVAGRQRVGGDQVGVELGDERALGAGAGARRGQAAAHHLAAGAVPGGDGAAVAQTCQGQLGPGVGAGARGPAELAGACAQLGVERAAVVVEAAPDQRAHRHHAVVAQAERGPVAPARELVPGHVVVEAGPLRARVLGVDHEVGRVEHHGQLVDGEVGLGLADAEGVAVGVEGPHAHVERAGAIAGGDREREREGLPVDREALALGGPAVSHRDLEVADLLGQGGRPGGDGDDHRGLGLAAAGRPERGHRRHQHDAAAAVTPVLLGSSVPHRAHHGKSMLPSEVSGGPPSGASRMAPVMPTPATAAMPPQNHQRV